MIAALFKLLLIFLVLRVGWGAWNWVRAIGRAATAVREEAATAAREEKDGYDAGKNEIEDAVFEEIPEEPGNDS